MEPLYIEVLTRTLQLPPSEKMKLNYVYKTVNNTTLPLICKMYSHIDLSPLTEGQYIQPRGGILKQTHLVVGDCQIFTCAATGAFVGAKLVEDVCTDKKYEKYSINPSTQDWNDVPVAATVRTALSSGEPGLIDPNDIGGLPIPRGSTLIPSDSGKFVVGAGLFDLPPPKSKKVVLIHEQFWRRSPSSFTMAPKSKKSVALVITTGRTETTSTCEQIKANLGIDVSGGWGPVTASMSASLEYGASTNRVVSVTETSQVTVEDQYENDLLNRQMLFLYWNLVDAYVFVDFDMNSTTKPVFTVLGLIESVQTPSLLRQYQIMPPVEAVSS